MDATSDSPTLPLFTERLSHPLRSARRISTLQINIGLVCNLACKHCHVESSPKRTGDDENLSRDTGDKIMRWLADASSIQTVDLTGGSPEMNPHFKWMVEQIRLLGRHVIDRCNPTIIGHTDPKTGASYQWIPEFLAQHQVEVFASLPCYLEDNVRVQRGLHAYDASIDGLKALNDVGYGRSDHLPLNLVFNPTGASLPPAIETLEADYRRELSSRFGLAFTRLVTITNMPIARWKDDLARRGKLAQYESLLAGAFNPATIDGLMCRHQIHINSQGDVYDCDFNYAMNLPTPGTRGRKLWDILPAELADRSIATASHCYGCTAGSGSSCGGSLA